MITSLRLFLLACACLYFGVIGYALHRRQLELRDSLVWLTSGFAMLLFIVFPQILFKAASLVGIIDPTNLVFFGSSLLTLMILFYLSIVVSSLYRRLRRTIQTQALLEQRLRELEDTRSTRLIKRENIIPRLDAECSEQVVSENPITL